MKGIPVAKTKKQKAEQKHIEGLEPVRIPAIDKAAEKYEAIRDQRQSLTADEVEAKDDLLGLMKEHELTTYTYDSKVVEVIHLDETVKVRPFKAPKLDA